MADGTMPSYYHKVDGQWKNIGGGLHVVTRYVAFDDAAVMINQESKFVLHKDLIFGRQYVCGPEMLNLLRPLVKKGYPCIGIGANGTIRYQFKVSVGVKPLGASVSGVDGDGETVVSPTEEDEVENTDGVTRLDDNYDDNYDGDFDSDFFIEDEDEAAYAKYYAEHKDVDEE